MAYNKAPASLIDYFDIDWVVGRGYSVENFDYTYFRNCLYYKELIIFQKRHI